VDVTAKLIIVERMSAQAPAMVTQVDRELTGGAESHYVTNQSAGMRKGSVWFRRVASKGSSAVRVVGGYAVRHRHRSQRTTE
jgi:hypothetical protein